LTRLGVITGLARETDCLDVFDAATRPLVRCAGARPERTERLARELVDAGCLGLLSFGIAGGLVDGMATGTVVVADGVVAPGGRVYPTSESWRRGLMEGLLAGLGAAAPLVAPLAGVETVVATEAAKRALAAETSAVAVDMESHRAAAVADAAGLPFLVIRAVSDPVTRPIPAWLAGRSVAEDGTVRHGAVLLGLAARPWAFPALLGLRRDSARALAALRRVAGLAGPRFGLA